MALNHYFNTEKRNKYCKIANLRNESDVEQFFILPLLKELGFTQDYIRTKTTIAEKKIGKGKKRKVYRPDYIGYIDKKQRKPVLIIDAKHPNESPESGVDDAQLYAFYLRKELDEPKPEQYCIGTNGLRLIVKHYDRDEVLHELYFDDFIDGNPKFERLKSELNRQNLQRNFTKSLKPFEFKKPDLSEIKGIFEICHKIIWKKEKMNPQAAFFEFCKIMFVKLNEDKKLRSDPELKALIEAGKPLPAEKVVFSKHWIEQNEMAGVSNPINTLFRKICEEFEYQIIQKKKKRIFDKDEQIRVSGETVKAVVERLEHYDLFGIDEDLNGRLFETFLSATMRGKELGQFFTPRTIVEFMTELAELEATREKVDNVIDACCGTGGFLIEAMAKMVEKVNNNPTLSGSEKEELIKKIRDEKIFGIDAGKEPPIARIARINMYLHGDGGSRIYFADALDKGVYVDENIDPELKAEREELRKLLVEQGIKFDVVLTNPPFAMSYSRKEKDEERILNQYKYVVYYRDKSGKKKLRATVNSNVLFLERYYDLLKEGGKLLIIIDESVLNTDKFKEVRDFILDKFIVRAVISLPRWAFFQAESNAKTSILYLVKKKDEKEEQPYTFYARSENIGYEKTKPDPSKSDLPAILKAYFDFQRKGRIPDDGRKHWSDKSKFFVRKLDKNLRRLDFEWLDPRHEDLQRILEELRDKKGYVLRKLGGAEGLCHTFRGKTPDYYVSEGIPIIKTRNVTGEGIDWNTDFVHRTFFESNIDKRLLPNDILLNSTGVGSIGNVDLFDKDFECMTDGHVSVLRIKDPNEILPKYLLYYLRSVFGQMQIERFTVGYTGQIELNRSDLEEIIIAYPVSVKEQKEIIKTLEKLEEDALRYKNKARENLNKISEEFVKNVLSD